MFLHIMVKDNPNNIIIKKLEVFFTVLFQGSYHDALEYIYTKYTCNYVLKNVNIFPKKLK